MSEEETDAAAASGPTVLIQPASTGVTALVGHSQTGPVGVVQKCETQSQFNRHFGDHEDAPILAAAVYGFFENGGQTCLVLNLGAEARSLGPGDLDLLDKESSIELVCAPGKSDPADHHALLNHCSSMGTRLAILDCPADLATQLARFRPPALAGGAVYAPWLLGYDPIQRETVPVPPSGHIAGMIVKTGAERGLRKSPANEPLQGVTGLAHDITQQEQDILYPRRINCIRNMPDLPGCRPWGEQLTSARPLGSVSSFRVWSFIVRSIEGAAEQFCGRINEPELWRDLETAVSTFLEGVSSAGTLASELPEEAFRVRCDESINNRGTVVWIEIGLALGRPGRFYTFKMGLDLEP